MFMRSNSARRRRARGRSLRFEDLEGGALLSGNVMPATLGQTRRIAGVAANTTIVIQTPCVGHDLTVTTGDGTGIIGASFGFGNIVSIDSTTVGHDLAVATGAGTGGSAGNEVAIGEFHASPTTVSHDLTVTVGAGTGGSTGN